MRKSVPGPRAGTPVAGKGHTEVGTLTPRSGRDPRVFLCADCGMPMTWIPDDPGVLLHCSQQQCANALMPIQVWRAQQHRENLGLDAPSPPAGWPRPVLDGLPVPFIVPVTNGRPWWGLIDRERLH